jgi:hypothetical protein
MILISTNHNNLFLATASVTSCGRSTWNTRDCSLVQLGGLEARLRLRHEIDGIYR